MLLNSLCQEVNNFSLNDCSGKRQEERETFANDRSSFQKEETSNEDQVTSTTYISCSVPTELFPLPVIQLRDIRHREDIPTTKWIKSFFYPRAPSPQNVSSHVDETKSFLLCYPSLSEYLSIYAESYLAVELESECTFPPYYVLDRIDYDDLHHKLSEIA